MASGIERLIYASRWTPGLIADVDEAVRGIVAVSVFNNRRDDITGLLVVEEGWFVQVLEGSSPRIGLVMDRILQDRRHMDVKLLGVGLTRSREFGDWNMAAARPGSEAAPLLTELGMAARFNGHRLDGSQALALLIAVGDAQRRKERRLAGAT